MPAPKSIEKSGTFTFGVAEVSGLAGLAAFELPGFVFVGRGDGVTDSIVGVTISGVLGLRGGFGRVSGGDGAIVGVVVIVVFVLGVPPPPEVGFVLHTAYKVIDKFPVRVITCLFV
jgi:hypothetical protein